MSNIQVQEIRVDDETTLQVLRHGVGQPSALLLAGIHGGEKTGPELLHELSNQLASIEMRGRVSLLPIANPKTYAANQRIHPGDGLDLNRCFLGGVAPLDSPTGRLVAVIQQLIAYHNLVIDIHTFPNQWAPVIGVALGDGIITIRQRSEALLQIFSPETIWELDTRVDEPAKSGSACSYALENGIMAFGLELPPPEYYSKAHGIRTLNGLFRVLKEVGCIAVLPELAHVIPRYKRKLQRALSDGIFVPQRQLSEAVVKGDILGEFITTDGDISIVEAEFTGVVLTIAPRSQLQDGQKILAIGIPIQR